MGNPDIAKVADESAVKKDPTEGISHLPLSEAEKKDPLVALKNLPGYVTLAFGRMYQDKIREGGGTPDTSNRVVLAAAGKSSETIGEAALAGGAARARKQIEFWGQNGVVIPDAMKASVESALAVGYVALNVAEAGVLVGAGQEPYKQLLDLELKGGVVDWDGGGTVDTSVSSGTQVGYNGPTASPSSTAAAEAYHDPSNWR